MTRAILTALLTMTMLQRAEADPTKPPRLVLPPLSPLSSPEASLSPLHLGASDLLRVERRARWKRNVGIGLAVPGITLMVLGGIVIGLGVKDPRLVTGAAEIAAGSVSAASGVLLTIPGSILWVTGQDGLDLAAWRRMRME